MGRVRVCQPRLKCPCGGECKLSRCHPVPFTHTAPDWPEGRPGQGGSRQSPSCALQSSMPSRQQLPPVPSPGAREAAAGLRRGQMAGDRLGGTAEWWKVGSGHLAMTLATQLFSPHGEQEQLQQQAETKVRVVGTPGAAPCSWEASPGRRAWQYLA